MLDDPLVQIAGQRDNSHDNWPITAVLEALDWDGVLSRRSSRNGWVYVECCPFHAGDGGAAYNEELNSYRCWGCDARGNSVTLIMQQRNLDARDAVDWLNDHVDPDPPSRPTRQAADSLPWERGWDG